MGGDGPTTFDRVVEFCDGWIPLGYRPINMAEKISGLKQKAEKAKRDWKTISISVFGAKPEQATIDEYEKFGVERAIFMLPAAPRDTVLPLMDQYARFIKK